MTKQQGVVVLGGLGLIGGEIVRNFRRNGISVVVADIHAESKSSDPGVSLIEVDVCDEAQMRALPERVEDFVRPTAVVNATYPPLASGRTPLSDLHADAFVSDVSSHLMSAFLVAQVFGSYLSRSEGGGSIVNLASIYGFKTPRFEIYDGEAFTMPIAYAVSKSGIIMMTRYFAEKMKKGGVRFNCVSPGGVLDGHSQRFRQAYGRFSSSSDLLNVHPIAAAVSFLCSPDAAAITGLNLVVDEGWSL